MRNAPPEQDHDTRPLSKSKMAYVSPRLGILNIPFTNPFKTRVTIFRHFVSNDLMLQEGREIFDRTYRMCVVIHRENVAWDGFDKLCLADLKGTIEITFIDKFGQEE